MGILGNIIEHEQLSIRECYSIENGTWHEYFREGVVTSLRECVMDKLDCKYGPNDPTNSRLFSEIISDVPCIIGDYLYEMGYITKARRDEFTLDVVRESPFWGVPEVPQFSIPIRLRLTETSDLIHIHVSNLIWEKQWKGVEPVAYDKFIRYMHLYWHRSLGFECNPDPWKTLQDVINNPQDYEYLM